MKVRGYNKPLRIIQFVPCAQIWTASPIPAERNVMLLALDPSIVCPAANGTMLIVPVNPDVGSNLMKKIAPSRSLHVPYIFHTICIPQKKTRPALSAKTNQMKKKDRNLRNVRKCASNSGQEIDLDIVNQIVGIESKVGIVNVENRHFLRGDLLRRARELTFNQRLGFVFFYRFSCHRYHNGLATVHPTGCLSREKLTRGSGTSSSIGIHSGCKCIYLNKKWHGKRRRMEPHKNLSITPHVFYWTKAMHAPATTAAAAAAANLHSIKGLPSSGSLAPARFLLG